MNTLTYIFAYLFDRFLARELQNHICTSPENVANLSSSSSTQIRLLLIDSDDNEGGWEPNVL